MKRDGKDVTGSRCYERKRWEFSITEQDSKIIRKKHMGRVMNEKNGWDQIIDVDVVERPIKTVTVEEAMTALRKMKSRKATRPLEIISELIIASDDRD